MRRPDMHCAPALALAFALLVGGAGACGGAGPSASRSPTAAPTALLSPTATPSVAAGLPFRMPCGDTDFAGCSKGCGDKVVEDCVTLASMYMAGEGVAADKERGIGLLKDACEAESARGCMRLGDTYKAGLLVGDAEETAAYRKACDAGANLGCVAAGRAYLTGRGVTPDAKLSSLLFGKVCDRGNAAGCFELAKLFESGEGVKKKDDARAFQLYSKACHLGLDEGCLAASRTEEVAPLRN